MFVDVRSAGFLDELDLAADRANRADVAAQSPEDTEAAMGQGGCPFHDGGKGNRDPSDDPSGAPGIAAISR